MELIRIMVGDFNDPITANQLVCLVVFYVCGRLLSRGYDSVRNAYKNIKYNNKHGYENKLSELFKW